MLIPESPAFTHGEYVNAGRFIWALHARLNMLERFPVTETASQYRYTDGGHLRILRKDEFVDGVYRDNLQTYFGLDRAAVVERAVADQRAQLAKLRDTLARNEALLEKLRAK